MFEQLIIHNFQKWKHYILDFDELLTVLVGNNDAGKSTIVRALRWVCLNKPPRKGKFINWDADTAEVELKVTGHSIIRRQGPNENCYILDDKKYVALGAGNVPPEIEEILNVDSDNFHKQLDSHFWFSETAGDVGKKLNSIVNLSVIDKSMTNIASMLKKARGIEDLTQTRLDQAKRRKDELSWIIPFEKQLSSIESKQVRIQNLTKDVVKLRAIVGKGQMLAKRITMQQQAANALQTVCEKAVKLASKRQQLTILKKLVQDYTRLSKIKPPPDITPLINKHSKLVNLSSELKKLKNLVNIARVTNNRLFDIDVQIDRICTEIECKFGKICPVCLQNIV